MCGCSTGSIVLFHNKQKHNWEFAIIPSGKFEICKLPLGDELKVWKKYVYAHISGRATVAVYGCFSEEGILLQIYRYYNNQENFMEV